MAINEHWLGNAEQWGLTPGKLGELADELDDHVATTAEREGHEEAEAQRESLKSDKTRRRLSANFLAEQVYATLNRWPTRREWLEFMWLGVWFVLIMLSDWLSLHAESLRISFNNSSNTSNHLESWLMYPDSVINAVTLGWVAQAVARAGFFASLIASLWRAYQTGWGVLIARILQLKLIHTVLVIIATMMLGGQLWNSYPYTAGLLVEWPTWLISPNICIPIAAVGIVICLGWKRRYWQLGLGMVLTALFMYPAGPFAYETIELQHHLVYKTEVRPGLGEVNVPDTDPERNAKLLKLYQSGRFDAPLVMVDGTPMTVMTCSNPVLLPLHAKSIHRGTRPLTPKVLEAMDATVLSREVNMLSPMTIPGAGLAWLAAPIPFMGVLGFLGLILVMGRRGAADMLAYTVLTMIAICTTILPFMFASDTVHFFDFTPIGVVHAPFPGFEGLLVSGNFSENGLLIFGLVLSAGIPWLLTGLFLKPKQRTDGGPDEAIAE